MLDRVGLWERNRMQDLIYIKDLRVQTLIGIFGWEREVRQEVSIDLEMTFDCKRAAKTDAIEDTIDYKKITKGIIKFVEESKFQLQETLAEGIADLVKNEYKIDSLKLRVSKPGALRHAEDVGVIIHR
jgi:dihydroneopterin aldolase